MSHYFETGHIDIDIDTNIVSDVSIIHNTHNKSSTATVN